MYTALATKADLAHQAQLFSERLERLRLEIRADRLEDMATLRAEIAAGDGSLRDEMHAGFRKLEDADAAIRVEIAQLANTLTRRMGAGLAAVAGLVIAA